MFASGENVDGRCGLPCTTTGSNLFHLVKLEEALSGETEVAQGKVTHVGATWEASLFVINSQRVYTCGTGTKGELALGPGLISASTPQLILNLHTFQPQPKIVEVATGMSHVVVLSSEGSLFGWGSCRKGQLGAESVAEKVLWSARQISSGGITRSIAVGKDFTAVIESDDKLKIWGDTKHFQDNPTKLSVEPGAVVRSGWSNIFILSHQRLTGLGRDNHGQLPPYDLPSLSMLACGSEHCLAVSLDGQVLAWGWGEHGNCGLPLDDKGRVRGRWNEVFTDLQAGERIVMVAAGCATSFIVVAQEAL